MGIASILSGFLGLLKTALGKLGVPVLAYHAGTEAQESETQEANVEAMNEDAEIAARPNASRSELLSGMRDGDL